MKPNLLFIFTDEQRFDSMRCYGNEWIHTPNLDRLAGESFVFENAYVTQPVCTPARASLMTGQYPHTHGCITTDIALDRETRTIAEMMSDEYLCGYFGKWHLGDEVVAQHGFEQWKSLGGYRRCYSKEEYLRLFGEYSDFLLKQGVEPDGQTPYGKTFSRTKTAELPLELTKAMFVGRETARFLSKNRDRPFVLCANIFEPHSPYTGPFNDMYQPDAIPVGPHFMQRPETASLRHRAFADRMAKTSESWWRRQRAHYFGLVTLADRAVGVMLDALDEYGLAENTIVVFTSDHGNMLGEHLQCGKCLLYQESIKVPLLLRVPWLAAKQQRIPGHISQVDLVPTLLDLLEQPIPQNEIEGDSRTAVLRGEKTLKQNDVFVEWNTKLNCSARVLPIYTDKEEICDLPWRTVISSEGWKLNFSPVDQCELYDLNNDPYEQTNLFDDARWQERISDLIARIRAWQERTGDEMPLEVVPWRRNRSGEFRLPE